MALFENLALPLMCAPMSIASSVPLAVACCRAGVIGGWQGGTATPLDEFERYLEALAQTDRAPPIVNLPSRIASEETGEAKLALLERHRVRRAASIAIRPAIERLVQGWAGGSPGRPDSAHAERRSARALTGDVTWQGRWAPG